VSASDHSVSESDVIEIECEVLYASTWWSPVIQCFPETPAEVVTTNNVSSLGSVNATLMYRKTVDVTPCLNNVEFDCRVSFPSTAAAAAARTHLPIFTCGHHLPSTLNVSRNH